MYRQKLTSDSIEKIYLFWIIFTCVDGSCLSASIKMDSDDSDDHKNALRDPFLLLQIGTGSSIICICISLLAISIHVCIHPLTRGGVSWKGACCFCCGVAGSACIMFIQFLYLAFIFTWSWIGIYIYLNLSKSEESSSIGPVLLVWSSMKIGFIVMSGMYLFIHMLCTHDELKRGRKDSFSNQSQLP